MLDFQLGAVESRFADLVWLHQPLASSELVALCADAFNWKKSTTYTVLKRLCDKGLFVNDSGTVKAKLSREEFYSAQSERFLQEGFNGSLPAFLAAFSVRKPLSREDVQALRKLVDSFEEE